VQEVKNKNEELKDEIARMTQLSEPTSNLLPDILKKLKIEDPSRFRDVMGVLEY